MEKLQSTPAELFLVSDNRHPETAWWMQQWLTTMIPFARLQLTCWEVLGDVMQQEAEFLRTLTVSTQKLTACAWNPGMLRDPAAMASCYQEVAGDMAEASVQRMLRVTEFSREFRECLWDEI